MEQQEIDTVVIGAGQSGLAISYCLTQLRQPHLVLERGRLAERWRSRWDSVALQFPNFRTRLPGYPYQGDDPDSFKDREQIIRWLEDYAALFDPPLRCGVEVTGLRQAPGSGRYLVETPELTYHARNVVIATGPYQGGQIPEMSARLPAGIHQLHSSQYQNPEQIPPGAVLVVGTGASGSQIAEELLYRGRRVYLCVGRHRRQPRRYRGKDSAWWMVQLNQGLGEGAPRLGPLGEGRGPAMLLTGVRGGHDINLRQYAADGMVLLGRLQDIQQGKLVLAPDLEQNLAAADEAYWAFRKGVDAYIQRNGLDVPEEPLVEQYLPAQGEAAAPLLELDLQEAGITTVLWATGYRYEFGWVHLPLFNAAGDPIQKRGVSEQYPGIYFLGLRGLSRSSSAFDGMSDDAQFLAEQIAA